MRYENIKTYDERCDAFQGIVTTERLAEILIDEIEELRDYVEMKRKPLTDEEIDKVTDAKWSRNNHKPIYAAHRSYARAIERAHGIGGDE